MSNDPEQIEEKIEHTRARLSQNLDALGDRMSPGSLVDEAMKYFDTGPKEFAGSLGGQVQRNPIAALMTAAGVAWMAFGEGKDPARRYTERGYGTRGYGHDDDHDGWSGDRHEGRTYSRFDADSHADHDRDEEIYHLGGSDLDTSRSYSDVRQSYGETYDLPEHDYETYRTDLRTYDSIESTRRSFQRTDGETDSAYYRRLDDTYARTLNVQRNDGEDDDSYRARIRAAVDSASDKGRQARESLSRSARDARSRMARMRDDARRRMGDMSDEARRYADEMSDEAAYRARMAKRRAAEFHEENPLVTGAIAMAVGALAGSLFPVTRQERDALAPVADDLIVRGANLAEQGAEHVEALAETGAQKVEAYAQTAEEKAEEYRNESVLRTGTHA